MTLKNVNDHSQKDVCTHIILKSSINDRIKKLFIRFHALIDLNASEKVFINRKFAQSLNLDLIALKTPRPLETFDESKAVCGPITHYVEIYFKASLVKEGVRFTRFYVTDLSHWPIVFEASWFIENKAHLNFEKMTVEIPIESSEALEFSGSFVFQEIPVSLKSIAQAVNAPAKYESVSMISIHEDGSLIDVNVIGAAAFSRLVRKKNYSLEVFSLKDIEKTLSIKLKPDLSTLIWKEIKRHLLLFEPKKVDKLPSHRPYDHKIELLPNKKLEFDPLYEMFRDELLVLEKYLKKNLSKEFIKFSQFDCSFSVLFVKKFEKELRFCVDYRRLNAITKKNRYSMSLITKILNRLCKAKYYIKIDIMVAFNRLRIFSGSEKFTAFRTRFDLFEYLVMSFELCNASVSWQHFINNILREHLNDFCTAYADNILIYSNTRKEYIEHCHWILDQLKKAGLTCDIEKCEFCVQKVKYLNLIITIDGIKMNLEKIAAIVEWETFNSVKEIQAFLEFANFYRRFIRKFSKIAKFLNDLTHKDRAFKWIQKCQKAFEELKIAFTTASILKHFDFDVENIVEIDVFDERLDGVLSQYESDGLLHSVAFFSKKMIFAECNYEIYDKKLLVIIKAFEKWKLELKGFKFPIQVITDHKNLEYFMSSKLLNRKQARWSEYLFKFNFKINYRSEKLNNVTDSLSRAKARSKKKKNKTMWQTVLKQDNLHIQACSLWNSVLGDDNASNAENALSEISINNEEKSLKDQFSAACAQDKKYQQILKALRIEIRTIKEFPLAKCIIINDQIQYRAERTIINPDADEPEYRLNHEKLLVSNNDELRLKFISLSHDTSITGHSKANKIYEILFRKYFWINMIVDIKQFTRNCHLCRRVKPFHNKYSETLRPLPVFEIRWQDISIDFIVKLSKSKNIWKVECENMMIVVNWLFKQTHIKFIDELTPERVAQIFYNISWRIHDLPESIVSNRGTQFVSHFWKQLTCRLRVMARLFTAYHPETNDQTEIRNFAIEDYLRTFCAYLQDDWAL